MCYFTNSKSPGFQVFVDPRLKRSMMATVSWFFVVLIFPSKIFLLASIRMIDCAAGDVSL